MTDDLSSAEATQAAPTNGGAHRPDPPAWSSDVARELSRIYGCVDETRMQIGALQLLMVITATVTVLAVTGAVIAIRKAVRS